MSAIFFHSPSGDARLHGPERHWFGYLCQVMMFGILDLKGHDSTEHPLRRFFPNVPSGYRSWAEYVEVHLGTHLSMTVSWNGKETDWFSVMLNTAFVLGGPAVQLAARLHGQSELHAYVEGANRVWLADLIRQGRNQKVFRDSMGWEAIVTLLESSTTEPVVTSFSGSNQFPNLGLVERHRLWTPPSGDPPDLREAYEDPTDAWFDLPDTQQWELAMQALRTENQSNFLELKPADWDTFHFDTGVSALDIMHRADELTPA